MSGPGNASRLAARRFRFAVALAAALALVQTLGLLHGIAHGGHFHDDAPAAALVDPSAGAPEPDLLQALFSAHEDASDCVLFDCISHAEGACAGAEPLLAAAPAPAALAQAHPSWHVAAPAHGFQARAPPPVS
jgi:hypothetical protein